MIFVKLLLNGYYIKIVEALSFHERLYGLMGKTNISFGMLFPKCNSIHTFFMKENIDVVGLNDKNEIVFVERNVSKNKIIKIHLPIKKTSILELPKNTSQNLNIGDKLFFEFEDVV